MPYPVYSATAITEKLTTAPYQGWSYQDGFLQKDFLFKDFKQAMAFLVQTAMVSEQLNHHANWSGVYNQVRVCLQTHDAHGITQLDFEWAAAAEKIAQALII